MNTTSNIFCIYVFSDEWGVPRYVGKSKNFNVRIKQHLNRDRFRYKSHFYNWLNKCISEEIEYFVDILEEVTQENWKEREVFWIKHIKENGYKLTNMTDGGDGNNNQIFSEESKKQRSESRKGVRLSERTKQLISERHKGRLVSTETRLKLSEINKGKPCLESTKLKFSKSVTQLDLNGNILAVFKSLTDAANSINCRKSSLANAIIQKNNGKFKGFLWKYES